MVSLKVVIDEALNNPEFKSEWDRAGLPRAIAILMVEYRQDHNLTQEQLANYIGWDLSLIQQLELGE